MFVFMLVLLAVVAGDKLTYLNFLDAEFFCHNDYGDWRCRIYCEAHLLEVF